MEINGMAGAEEISTPQAAVDALIEGNKRFMAGTLTSYDLAAVRKRTEKSQAPFACVLACADSRIPVEMVFDKSPGQLFVARVAGNFVTPEILGTLEFGAALLRTKTILVVGHSGCGAVTAAIAAEATPGVIGTLFPPLRQAVDEAGPDVEATVKANARIQARLLRESSPVLAGLVKEKKLTVLAGYYDLGSGKVTMLD